MILTGVSIVFMTLTLSAAGFLVSGMVCRLFGYRIRSFDSVIMAGVLFATVYAQVFSLFAGVAFTALLVFCIASVSGALVFRKDIRAFLAGIPSDRKRFTLTVFFILLAVIASIASCEPADYDTYLYHAQAIKWIERYGQVRGLANLHPRFGYNSAYMCFQALFSLSFLGRSLHQSNGFIVLIMLTYAITGSFIAQGRKPDTSDLLKASMIFYAVFSLDSMSSPGTDIFPMLALLYIFSRWTEVYRDFAEMPQLSGEKGLMPAGELKERSPGEGALIERATGFGLLCMLSVLCITVKLSIAPVILLAACPLYILIKNKDIKRIITFIVIAVLIGIPFIIRNVLLTGYLLYPMEKLDLLKVDWKVPAERAFTDRMEIGLYAKSMIGMELKSYPLKEWVQVWYRNLSLVPRALFAVSGLILLFAGINIIIRLYKRKADEKAFLNIVAMVCYIYWFLMAPNMRYGIVNLLLVSSLGIGMYMEESEHKAYIVFLMLCTLAVFPEKTGVLLTQTNLVYPDDYRRFECRGVYLRTPQGREETVYVPVEGDQSGVDVFPETPSADPEHEMLRGESLKDGFRSYR